MDVREVLNAIFYILATGCQWSALPKDLPTKSTVSDYLARCDSEGTIERIHHALYVGALEAADREAGPTTALIDSQAKAAQKGAPRLMRLAMRRARKLSAASATCWVLVAVTVGGFGPRTKGKSLL